MVFSFDCDLSGGHGSGSGIRTVPEDEEEKKRQQEGFAIHRKLRSG